MCTFERCLQDCFLISSRTNRNFKCCLTYVLDFTLFRSKCSHISIHMPHIKMCTFSHSLTLLLLLSCWVMSNSFVTPWTIVRQATPSIGIFRLEYWSGLTFPSPEDLPNPGIETKSPELADGFFTTKPGYVFICKCIYIISHVFWSSYWCYMQI